MKVCKKMSRRLRCSVASIASIASIVSIGFGLGMSFECSAAGSGTGSCGSVSLFDAEASPFDSFGTAVALSGNAALVGVRNDDFFIGQVGGPDAGSARIHRFDGATWQLESFLFASDAAPGDFFGGAVALEGNVAVVGSDLDDTGGGEDAGSVTVFRRVGLTWIEEARLFAADGATRDFFGGAVAISGDAIIVGSRNDDHAGGPNAGSAYIFRFNGTTWVEEAHLFASDAAGNDLFGISVALSGNKAIVGASFDTTIGGLLAGSAFVYRFDGVSWVEEAHLFASDASALDQFGVSVSISGDLAAVGSWFDDTINPGDGAPVIGAGSAYIFRFSGVNWIEEAHLFASDAASGDNFGVSLSIRDQALIVGAGFDDIGGESDAGSAYLFGHDGTTWTGFAQLFADDSLNGDNFGLAVAIDGSTVWVGAPGDDLTGGVGDAGSAYAFSIDCNSNGVFDFTDIASGFSPDNNGNGIPDECENMNCPGDLSPLLCGGDGVVDVDDVAEILDSFGPCPPSETEPCPGDITPPGGNGFVNIDDLVAVLKAFGSCP